MFTFEDRGTLTMLDGGRLEFAGRKASFEVPVIRAVRYGRMGMDLLSNWVIVEFERGGDISEAHFSDGRWLGWRGIFGGTKRLYRALTEGSSD